MKKFRSFLLCVASLTCLSPAWAADEAKESGDSPEQHGTPLAPQEDVAATEKVVARASKLFPNNPVWNKGAPEAVECLLFSFLSPVEFARVMRVAKGWQALATQAHSDFFWKRLSKAPEALQGFHTLMFPNLPLKESEVCIARAFSAFLKQHGGAPLSGDFPVPLSERLDAQCIAWGYFSAASANVQAKKNTSVL